jgi:hypothetical protein
MAESATIGLNPLADGRDSDNGTPGGLPLAWNGE